MDANYDRMAPPMGGMTVNPAPETSPQPRFLDIEKAAAAAAISEDELLTCDLRLVLDSLPGLITAFDLNG